MDTTPHNSAKVGEIAKTVILPGDPLRAKKMAEKFLTDIELVSSVRNNYVFTGLYKNTFVTIMSTGMGPASMGIYSHELFDIYKVENAIRVGTIGSLDSKVKIGDIVIAENAFTATNYNNIFEERGESKISCSSKLYDMAIKTAKENNIDINTGNIYTSDTFYSTKEKYNHIISLGAKGVEMEGASLYETAKVFNKDALCICTVSDEILTNRVSTSAERENNYDSMFVIALEMAVKLAKNQK